MLIRDMGVLDPLELGVAFSESNAGVPVAGRRFETMPLDGHAYLVSQGWEGRGTGLRQGAIAKPVALVQKKTLSGVGKDRDDAFPFWDQ